MLVQYGFENFRFDMAKRFDILKTIFRYNEYNSSIFNISA